MINLKEAVLSRLSIHRVGNKNEEDGIHFSEEEVNLDDPLLKGILQKYFFTCFKDNTFYNLSHESDINLNEVYHYTNKIIESPESLHTVSKELAKQLYECSDHPNIKAGDFCVAWIENCTINGEYSDAVGLFKVENKDTFLKISESFDVIHDQGINIERLDKGCLIFTNEKEKGFIVSLVDRTNKSNEANYWKQDFLQVKHREDNFFHTKNYMQLCKNFCSEVLDKKEEIEKTDQIDFLNRSASFFSNKESFNVEEFENEVISEPEIIDKFRGFIPNYEEKNNFTVFDEFEISAPAVKSNKKVFKSILKLDKNFHIYIHGNRNLIEKGYDEERQMNYYKVYYNEEKN